MFRNFNRLREVNSRGRRLKGRIAVLPLRNPIAISCRRSRPDLKIPPIRLRADFKQVFSVGQKITSKYFNLYYAGHSNIGLGIQISKQDVPTAVKRNYLRRIVREHVRMARHELPKAKLIFLGKREAGKAAKEDLHQCLEKLIITLIEQSK